MVTNRDGALELWQAESRSRLTIAVGAHLVPNATDLHVAPTPRAVLRDVVEGPTAFLVRASLEAVPLPLHLRADHLRQQAAGHPLDRSAAGRRFEAGPPIRPEPHLQVDGTNEVVEGLSVQSGHPVVGRQQLPQGLPELDQAPPFALPDALARLEQPVLGQPCGRLLGIR